MNRTTHFRDFAKCREEKPDPLVCDAGTKSAEGGLARAFYQNRKQWMPTDCHSSTLNSRLLNLNSTEQSENVYENKQSRS